MSDILLTPNDLRRFEDKYIPEPNCGCWLWHGAAVSGYGQFWIEGKLQLAHRVAYRHYVGAIPNDLELDHLCRVKSCINPMHLEPVTRSENVIRGTGPSATSQRKRGQTHCKRGHPLFGDNLTVSPRGFRRCRECQRLRNLARDRSKRKSNA